MSLFDVRPGLSKDSADIPETEYVMTELETAVYEQIRSDMAIGYQNLMRPRKEFNDDSLLIRDQKDWLGFNTYQEADGLMPQGDPSLAWRSNAIRPVERNKVISMAGHSSRRLGFIRLEATNAASDPDTEAADAVNALLDWVNANYYGAAEFMDMVLAAMVAPAVIVHTEYRETKRNRKVRIGADGFEIRESIDESLSGFLHTIVPVDQFWIENPYQKDVQNQRFVMTRRVQSFSMMRRKYGHLPKFRFVRPGLQLTFNHPNQGFYWVTDPLLQGEMCEEITYYTKDGVGAQVTIVNGVIVSEPDAPLEREDGLYPFAVSGYELIRPDFFWFKSLVFKVSRDANLLNTLYPAVVDGALLNVFRPSVVTGTEAMGGDVYIPGVMTAFRDKDVKVTPLGNPSDIGSGLSILGEIEKSLSQTSETQAVGAKTGNVTAYQISVREAEIDEAIGPFRMMLLRLSTQLTRLVLGDILQYLTLGEASTVAGKPGLAYKSFTLPQDKGGRRKTVKFEDLSDVATGKALLDASYAIAEQEGKDRTIIKADPVAVRSLRYRLMLTEDVLQPKTANEEHQRNVELLDRLIAVSAAEPGRVDVGEAAKVLLLSANSTLTRDKDRFILPKEQTQNLAVTQQGAMMNPNQGSNQGLTPPPYANR